MDEFTGHDLVVSRSTRKARDGRILHQALAIYFEQRRTPIERGNSLTSQDAKTSTKWISIESRGPTARAIYNFLCSGAWQPHRSRLASPAGQGDFRVFAVEKKQTLKGWEKKQKKIANPGFDPGTFGLWARRASYAPACLSLKFSALCGIIMGLWAPVVSHTGVEACAIPFRVSITPFSSVSGLDCDLQYS